MYKSLTAQHSGYYRVYVDGNEISNHLTEREAIEQAENEKEANPTLEVYYNHEYTVKVEELGAFETAIAKPSGGSPQQSATVVEVFEGTPNSVEEAVSGAYYAGPSGSNTWAGSQDNYANPCSITTAFANAVAGDLVYCLGGTYSNIRSLNTTNSGTLGNPITFKNYPGETPVFDGGYTVSSGRDPVFHIDNRSYITFDGLSVTRGSTAGFYLAYDFTTESITIRNCHLYDVVTDDNAAHIYINPAANNTLIENNTIHGRILGGVSNNVGSGVIMFEQHDTIIRNNEIYDVVNGIYNKHNDGDAHSILVEKNYVHDCSGRGIMWTQRLSTIQNNLIVDCRDGIQVYDAAGSCAQSAADGNSVLHNTVIRATGRGVDLERLGTSCVVATDTLVKNNLLYEIGSNEYRSVSVWPYETVDNSNTTLIYNLIYNSSFASNVRVLSANYTEQTAPLIGDQSTNIGTAPTFTNYAGGDYSLTPASAGYQAGDDGLDMGCDTSVVGVQ